MVLKVIFKKNNLNNKIYFFETSDPKLLFHKIHFYLKELNYSRALVYQEDKRIKTLENRSTKQLTNESFYQDMSQEPTIF